MEPVTTLGLGGIYDNLNLIVDMCEQGKHCEHCKISSGLCSEHSYHIIRHDCDIVVVQNCIHCAFTNTYLAVW